MGIAIKTNHKALILGDYESGKTTLAKHLLNLIPRSLAWDPRQDVFREGFRDFGKAKLEFQKTGKAVYHPGRGNLQEKFEGFCEFALTQSNAMVFVDEPAMLGGQSHLPQAFHDLHRLGHARGLGVMIATHSVWDLPHVFHQAHHWFIFRTTRPVELNVLRQVVSEEAIGWIRRAPQYHFWHRGVDHEGPVNQIPKNGVRKGGPNVAREAGGSAPPDMPVVRRPEGGGAEREPLG